MGRAWFAAGSVAGALAVAAGAFGAHALRQRLPPELLATFETGVRYQIYHAIALLAVGRAASRWPGPLSQAAGWLFAGGIVVFCGSLYALALTGASWLGALAPVGGVALILGWLALAATALKRG